MPTMTGKSSLAANVNSANVLSDNPFEFISNVPSVVRVALIVDVDLCNATFQSGGETLMQNSLIFRDAANFIPINIFHEYLKFLAAPGERLFMTFQNGVNAANVYWSVDVIPVG